MSTGFKALMALSKSHTSAATAEVEAALKARQRKEAEKRKEIEERERKEREMQARMRAKYIEDQKREEERRKKQEAERAAREREAQRKEDAARDALRYGPRRAHTDSHGYPASGSGRRRHSDDEDDAGGSALTREEKRQRRLEAEFRGGRSAARKATTASGYHKPGRRLPGGAVDITMPAGGMASSPGKTASIKERLTKEPPMLIKLNQNKRDLRTIDEIERDVRERKGKGKVLDGDSARTFNDWFGKAKKEPPKKPSPPPSGSATPNGAVASSSQPKTATGSASPHPLGISKPPIPAKPVMPPPRATSTPKPINKGLSFTKTSALDKDKPAATKTAAGASFPNRSRTPGAKPPAPTASASKPVTKKRPRSPSFSPSPSPPPQQRRRTNGGDGGENDISSAIWAMFGKNRSSYVQRDVFSDDEDMEAGASDLEKEELRSSRLAKKEDEAALEEERRREEEKRRRKKEKDRRG